MKPKHLRACASRPGRSMLESLRQFLTPQLWKQGHHAFWPRRPRRRWDLQPLVLVLLAMTWCCGDSQAERFETAQAFASACLPKRRRPGKTVTGFHKALAKLPARVLRILAQGLRQRLAGCWQQGWRVGEFIPFGVDGSRLLCPRTPELEQRLGTANKEEAAPSLWVTALVHLRLGLLWSWRLGQSRASERGHLLHMLPLLPAGAMVVADAGFYGFGLARALLQAHVHFLIRMSSHATLGIDRPVDRLRFREGLVYYWPAQKDGGHNAKPLRLRLLRLKAKKAKDDVWLLTDVLASKRLPWRLASQLYRWRWENEGLFRTYKRTLAKVKLLSRTLALVHREAEGSLLATQLLLAQGARAAGPLCSPRRVLLAIRGQMVADCGPRLRRRFAECMAKAQRERRRRTSMKTKRVWPRRRPHKPPKPPLLLTLTRAQKAVVFRQFRQTG
jgi:hypothetical protein